MMSLRRVLLRYGNCRLFICGSLRRQFSACPHVRRHFQKAVIPWVQFRKGALTTLFSSYILLRLNVVKMADESIIKEADALSEKLEFQQMYDLLIKHKDSKNPEILWRLARAGYKIREHKGQAEMDKAIEEGLKYLDEALAINNEIGTVHKWYAILMGSKKNHPSLKDQILEAFKIKEHLEKAIQLIPTDATTYHVLGNWCFEIASVSWYQRKAAQVLFATPPNSSYEEALANFEKAEQVDPGFFSRNTLMIAKTLLQMNKKDDAIKYLRKARDHEPKTIHDDKLVAEEAEQLLKKYGAA